jgi:thiol-disulfide isomerase/thioredoxin
MSETPITPDQQDHGRVGYGNLARYSPAVLALVMIVAIGYIALNRPEKNKLARDLIDKPAPALTLAFSTGQSATLESMRGQVVVLNFWAAWCDPCVAEMPAFQAVHAENIEKVRIIGINLKTDQDEAAATLLSTTGVTYEIAKDMGGASIFHGGIEDAFGATGPYPMTIIIAADGTVNAVKFGALDQGQIEKAIEKALQS